MALAVSILIAALAYQCIINIGNSHDLCGYGNLVPHQAIGITAAIKALVVVAGNIIAHLFVFAITNALHMLNNLAALHGVRLHDFKLFLGELARLEQNAIANRNLTITSKNNLFKQYFWIKHKPRLIAGLVDKLNMQLYG